MDFEYIIMKIIYDYFIPGYDCAIVNYIGRISLLDTSWLSAWND